MMLHTDQFHFLCGASGYYCKEEECALKLKSDTKSASTLSLHEDPPPALWSGAQQYVCRPPLQGTAEPTRQNLTHTTRWAHANQAQVFAACTMGHPGSMIPACLPVHQNQRRDLYTSAIYQRGKNTTFLKTVQNYKPRQHRTITQ